MMSDRESVITHLQIIHTWAEFARERDLQFFTAKHLEDIAQWSDDAIAMLKEQEAVKPVKEKGFNPPLYVQFQYVCNNCKADLIKSQPFCSGCGRAVEWE